MTGTLIRFKLTDYDGRMLPGESIEMARPGESDDDCLWRLRREFGGRLMEIHVEHPGGHEQCESV